MTYTMQKLLPTIIMKYDLVNNILGITNTADPQNIAEKNKAKLGGAYSHSYVYDDINRLISADGKAKTASYRLDMTYGIMGEPLTKKQKVDSSKGVAVVCVCLSVRGRRPPYVALANRA